MAARGFLHLIIHGAKNLPASDFKLVKKPSSDPYCVAKLGIQRHRTQTLQETLNPVWDKACSFQLGSFLSPQLLALVGHGEPTSHECQTLEFKVYDEDTFSKDDALGHCTLELEPLLKAPHAWQQSELRLEIDGGFLGRNGLLFVSTFWEPAPLFQPYVLRVAAVICTSTAFAMLLIAANCRWQRAPVEMGALKQPGVGAASMLGSGVLLLATALQFLLAHMEQETRLDDLAATQSANRSLNDTLAVFSESDTSNPLVKAEIRAARLMEYEVTVTPNIDITKTVHLPLVVLAWLLPVAGGALACVALVLQFLQSFTLHLQAGQCCCVIALGCIAAAYYCAFLAEVGPSQTRVERARSLELHKQHTDTLTEGIRRNSCGGQRRRDFIRNRFQGLFRGSPEES